MLLRRARTRRAGGPFAGTSGSGQGDVVLRPDAFTSPKRASNYLEAMGLVRPAWRIPRPWRGLPSEPSEAKPDTKESIEDTQRYLRGERDKDIRVQHKRKTAQARQLADEWRKQPASERRSRSLAGALDAEASMLIERGRRSETRSILGQGGEIGRASAGRASLFGDSRGLDRTRWSAGRARSSSGPTRNSRSLADAGRRSLSPYEVRADRS